MNLKNPLSWLSLGFGSGLSPVAPGTVGSIFAIAIYYFFFFGNIVKWFDHLIFISFVVLSFFVGLYIYPKTVKEQNDPGSFVWDEFVGMWVACIPLAIINHSLQWLIIAFVLFRIFDIAKPYPVSYYDKNFKNSFGVIMDDICAGLYVVAILVFYMIITT